MLDPILKLVFSVIFLRSKGVPPNEQFAAGAAAALIPGALGLAVPLVVAGRERSIQGGIVETSSDVVTLAEVPNVIGEKVENAKVTISKLKLNPVSTESFFLEDVAATDKGLVRIQDPVSGSFVPLGTDVTLTVSLGPPEPVPEQEDLALHRAIQTDVKALQAQTTVVQADIKAVKDKLEVIAAKPVGPLQTK